MGDPKVQEVEAFFLGHVVPRCGIKMQAQTSLIPKFTLHDHCHQLLEAIAAALWVLFCRLLNCLLYLTSPLSSDRVTRGSVGEGRVRFCP